MSASSPMPIARGIVFGTPALSRLVLVRGAVALLFGVVALIWPVITAYALALLFGVYAVLDGVGSIIEAFRHREWSHRLPSLVGGLLGVGAGVAAWVWPQITVLALAVLVGAWAVVTGLLEIFTAIKLRKLVRGEALLAAAGVLTVAAGVLVLLQPLAGAVGIAVVVGSYAVLYGVVLIVVGYRLRRRSRRLAL